MIKKMTHRPLAGRTILITRAREQSVEFGTRLRSLGAEVIEFPTIEIVPPLSWKDLDRAMDQLASYDWIIFTSVNGVTYFWQRFSERYEDARFPSSLSVCAIGPATANRLRERGVRVDYTPREFIAEAILDGFKKMVIQGKRVLLARVKKARDVLPQGLRRLGAEVDIVEAYRTLKPRGGSVKLRKILAGREVDVVTFTSSSTVNHFVELLKKEESRRLLKDVTVACIGPVTTRTAEGLGMKVGIQPKEYTIPALTASIVKHFAKE
jgi:uroporphyrinogen III methyltransferase/synthase